MSHRVLVVDDHELFRQGVVATLQPEADFEVVGESGSAQEALRTARLLRPDIILLDVHMPAEDGLAIVPTLSAELPDSRVVMLTVSEDPETVTDAIRLGAAGYLLKGIHADAMLEALRGIARGESYVSPEIAGRILSALNHPPPEQSARADLDSLTPRERDVLEGLARGDTNREIADVLTLSEKTVKRHVTGILTKLQARNRTEAAIRAVGNPIDGGPAT